ncbi:ATP-binding protein [Streptomyces sp. CAU 1734]|uniref:ATP-binding protein n=1 Tax=Streptomyces sp. CAU 1734 TaxID=3140360 RepID=UPI0032606D81
MKQSAAKTLAVAALGAAFAAAAAGTATAAPAGLPEPSLDSVAGAVPVGDTLTKLPAGAPESLAGAQGALQEGLATAPGTLQGAGQRALAPEAPTDLVGSLLGGLPVNSLTKVLPGGGLPTDAVTGGLPTGGLPTGGLPVGTGLI